MTRTRPKDTETYLLTGATGFLGSHIMAGLLLKGKGVVVTGRPSGGLSLSKRIEKLLVWFGIEHLAELIEYHETDFLKSRMGLGEDEYRGLCKRSLCIIHCASDTSFAERNRARVMKSNLESLTEILIFAVKSRTRCFHFLSSAYAAGSDCIECPEAPVTSALFTNVYEESKARAEQRVSERCRSAGLAYTILRPSVVFGDSVTGRSLRFNALYHPVRSLQCIRDIYLEDIRTNGGAKSSECGIHVNAEGTLHLPVRIFIPNEGNINLIPVDYFVKAILSILEQPGPEPFYHITDKSPMNMATLASFTERFLNIRGIELIIGSPRPIEMRNPPEELFHHFIKAYLPYMSDKRLFVRANTDNATRGALPPSLTYEMFRRCMDFAVASEWGKSLHAKLPLFQAHRESR
jgi:nucleoside-diphosphate-sugar epimerase